MLKKLERACKKHGFALIAGKLGYKDTHAVKQWIRRKAIPEKQIVNVTELLKKLK